MINFCKNTAATAKGKYLINDFTRAQIVEHAQMVARGGKAFSVMPIKKVQVKDAIYFATQEGVFVGLVDAGSDEWIHFWIFKHEEMFDIVKSLPSKPQTLYDHFILGLCFGYSVDAIMDFVGRIKTDHL